MKKAELTPQILRLYVGRLCDLNCLGDRAKKEITDFLILKHAESGSIITPHLRSLSSITEEEARDLFKISRGDDWDYGYNSSIANRDRNNGKLWSCLENWWKGDYEMFAENGNWIIGEPEAWLYLLSKGFDLFGLIEAGLAKEVEQ